MKSKIHLISYLPVGATFAPKEAASKLSSNAYLKTNEEPPRCSLCEKKLVPIFQIYLESGYFQFFYCANYLCKEFGSKNNSSAKNYVARLLPEELGLKIYQGAFGIEAKDIYIREDEEESASPTNESKIGGDPVWRQKETFPNCDYCKSSANMKFFMQISLPNIEKLPFGSESVLFFTRCMAHKERFGFVWQSN